MFSFSESIEKRTRDDDEQRVLYTSSTSYTIPKIISILTTDEPDKNSRRKRKRNHTSKIIIINSSSQQSSSSIVPIIGMFQRQIIMVIMILTTLSSSRLNMLKRIPIATGLSVTRTSTKTKTTRSGGGITTTTAGTTALLKTISISPAISSSSLSSSSALNLALDSRELRFYGAAGGGDTVRRRSSSSDSSNSKDAAADDVGTYYNQEWFASATLSATKDQNQAPVLALAGVGLEDNEELNKRINNFNKNKNINDSTSMNSSSNEDGGITNNKNNNSNESNNEEDGSTSSHYCYETEQQQQKQQQHPPPKRGYGPYINLSPEERELFRLIRKARDESGLSTTMRVAGGWVRDKLLATPEFTRTYGYLDNNNDDDDDDGDDTTIARNNGGSSSGSSNRSAPKRLTSKYKTSSAQSTSAGRFGGKVIGDGKKKKKKNNKNSINSKNASTAGSMQRFQQHEPVDIDIALDDMLGREFAELLNDCLSKMGEKTHGVGVVLKNPEKSKHLETATMKVGTFWIDFVNLRAEEYTQDSRIPDLMRIGTPSEDAFRRDLTINSLFYNVNNGQVEDWTGRGFEDLRRCVVSTPLAPLTTLLDDPLRTLRSVRFAARLRFTMDDALVEAAMDDRVRKALAEKVSRERIGCEVDLMLRSPDPVGAMRLLINLNLARTVFPIEKLLSATSTTSISSSSSSSKNEDEDQDDFYEDLFERGLDLLSTNYDQLEECKLFPPVWCNKSYQGSYTTHGTQDISLSEDDDALRYMWYASFLKPLYDHSLMIDPLGKNLGKKANRSVVCKLLVDELKRPTREAEAVGKIMKGANDFKQLMDCGGDFSAVSILLSDIRVHEVNDDNISSSSSSSSDDDVSDISSNASQGGVGSRKMKCSMNGQDVYTATENDPVWDHAMEFRLQCSNIMRKVGPLWRAALFLAMSEHITEALQDDLDYVIEGDIVDESQEDLRQREIERYDSVGTAMQRIGLVGIYEQKPLMDGGEVKKVLPNIPKGPIFRDIMDEQVEWMTLHPCAGADILARHLAQTFPDYQ